VKLLRVLQEREVEPVGVVEPEPIDVRIVAATNKDLEALVREGRFRQDLYYRLNVLQLLVPPLRGRPGDVPLLADTLLRALEKETGIPVDGIEPDALALLEAYPWPGNVRELRNVLEQALYVKTGRALRAADLPRSVAGVAHGEENGPAAPCLKALLRRTEEEAIRRALHEAGGDRLVAAARLGISKSSLYAKVEQYGLAAAAPLPVSRNAFQEAGTRRGD
jgi:transcriptional regulator with PAS, ATPase and Fis domain